MKLHYKMTAQEWKDLLDYLSARGCKLVHYPETDNNGLFVDFKYAVVEYGGMYFYLQCGFWDFSVTKYHKISPYEKQQSGYPRVVTTTEELLEYIKTQTKDKPMGKTHKQRIFLTYLYALRDGKTDLWRLEHELAGFREKEILANLDLITTVMHTKDYHVLRFHSKDGHTFDYETKSRRITG